ncbi:hypothetical protein CTEN210_04958 [Chaetoceros tenuissimus]|uniref:Dolichyl-diphosphooligosaccharide--protein glycosyltransferase subunit 2 n=1 Tax=Chaetoceros tenuissimus TaxID=426638 RepID=A0AAD3H2S3_9STRA|nr:hypothetical protein CTEN210_04958 [Chaetoceros tenuissimus]
MSTSTIVCLILFHFILALSDAAITAPLGNDTPIRLSTKQTVQNNDSNPLKHSNVVQLEFKHPVNNAVVLGPKLEVKITAVTELNEEAFQEKFKDTTMCLSLDNGPFFCTATNRAVMYSNVDEGEHTLVAKMYQNGDFANFAREASVAFTTTLDPAKLNEQDRIAFEEQKQLKKQNITSLEENSEEEELVEVTFPKVYLVSPHHRVTYSGTELSVETRIDSQDHPQFKKYFQNSYTCLSLDLSPTYFCHALHFNDSNQTKSIMIATSLGIGLHTVEAALSHPETGEILDMSKSGKRISFVAGKSMEGAQFVTAINLRGKSIQIPVAAGGNIQTQSQEICRQAGFHEKNEEDFASCFQLVLEHLVMTANQLGFNAHLLMNN